MHTSFNQAEAIDSSEYLRGRLKKITTLLVVVIVSFSLILAAFITHLTTSPNFPEGGVILQIEKGMSVKEITESARTEGIVRSSLLLYIVLTYAYDPTTIYAGTYSFNEPLSVFEVAKKLSNNEIDNILISITIPEGTTRKDIAKIIKNSIEDFDTNAFLELTKNNEGYLFPDTYFVPKDFSAENFVSLLTETFAKKLSTVREQIIDSSFTEYEVLILASILEREANSEESMHMVSGILQNRLKIGMALQTDASIEYVLDKSLSELQPEDLKTDTEYNTYLYPGLTPTPIGNPGMQAIHAVLNPTPSSYMFYITGTDGEFHYSKTFEEHKRNIQKYLK